MPLENVRPWFRSLNPADPEHKAIMFYTLCGGSSRRKPLVEAKWREFDPKNKVWAIPPENMKQGVLAIRHRETLEPFKMPLSDDAIALLGTPGKPDAYVFTDRDGLPFGKDALSLKRLFRFQGKDDPEPYGCGARYRRTEFLLRLPKPS